MYKIRIVYGKFKESMYLSHLDIMRVFERTFRRANIKLEYSNGFNPRPEIVFAHPLSVGIESSGEIFEAILTEKLPIVYLIRELNKFLPASITILSAEYVEINEKNIMSRVYASVYTIEMCIDDAEVVNNKELDDLKKWYKNKMIEYLDQEFILILKKTKEKKEMIDVKKMIIYYDFLINNNLQITLNSGSKSNLKPEYIMEGFSDYISKDLKYNIKREKIIFN